jgi:spore coat protein U-like protein
MTKRLVAAVALVVATAGGVSAAQVTPAPVVNATATVIGVCAWFQDGDIAFNVDPSAGGAISATVGKQPMVKCTNQTPFTVAASSANKGGVAASCAAPSGITGTLRSQSNAAHTFDYTFTCGSGTGVGAGFGVGKEQDVGVGGVGGLVSPAQYSEAVAHADYQDTVTLIVTY